MKKVIAFIFLFLLASIALFAQVAINTDNSPPNASAGLDVKFRLHPLCLGLQCLREFHPGYPYANNFPQSACRANRRNTGAISNSDRLELECGFRCYGV